MTTLPACKSVQDIQRAVSEGSAKADCIIPLPGGYAIRCFTPPYLYGVMLVSKYVYTTDDQFVAGSLDFCLKYLVEQGVLEDDGITTALLLRVLDNSARSGNAWLELEASNQTGHYIVRESGQYNLRARGTSSGPGKTLATGLSVIQVLREAIRLEVLK